MEDDGLLDTIGTAASHSSVASITPRLTAGVHFKTWNEASLLTGMAVLMPTGVTALCSKPVSDWESDSGANRTATSAQ